MVNMSTYRLPLSAAAVLALLVTTLPARAAEEPVLVGDPVHGRRLFAEHCGEAAARATLSSEQMASMQDEQLQAAFAEGRCVDSKKTFDTSDVDYLDAWDMVAFVRTRHLRLSDFFPDASRYIQKEYEIDQYGRDRLQTALGRVPDDLTHVVFTFYDFEGEKGDLSFVPQDPIMLDELDVDKKTGYLVFVPLETSDYTGEVAVAFDPAYNITGLQVHRTQEGAEVLNQKLAAYIGKGGRTQTGRLDVPKRGPGADIERAVSRAYLLAREAATMFVRDERARTWNE